MENTLSTHADGLPSGTYIIPEVTLPKYDTEFLLPTCTRERKSQEGRGKDGHFAAGQLASHNSTP